MEWAMRDEAVKVQMFRFIDVLPMLAESRKCLAAFARISGPGPRSAAGGGADRVGCRARGFGPAQHMLANRRSDRGGGQRPAVHRRRRRPRKCSKWRLPNGSRKRAFTLDILGEAVTSEIEAERYLQAYIDLIEAIAPTVNAWPEVHAIGSRRSRADSAGERVGEAFGPR